MSGEAKQGQPQERVDYLEMRLKMWRKALQESKSPVKVVTDEYVIERITKILEKP